MGMIVRIWRGQATIENADAYYRHVTGTVFPGLAGIRGHRGAYLLRRAEFRPSLDRIRDVLALAIFAAMLSTLVSPTIGVTTADTRNPNEKAPAVMPRSQPNSSRIGGNNSEKAVRALTPTAMVTKATPTRTQP